MTKKVVNSIILKPISKSLANAIIERYHYLHKKPNNVLLGVYSSDSLKGVIIFGTPVANNTYKMVKGTTPRELLELKRLWISDELGKNTES